MFGRWKLRSDPVNIRGYALSRTSFIGVMQLMFDSTSIQLMLLQATEITLLGSVSVVKIEAVKRNTAR